MSKKFLEGLNKQQKEAVLATSGPLAIIAGAGSGKTRTITHKIAHLIENKTIKPERLLAVTFTNKAANEMKDRVIQMVGEEQGNLPTISTYHSLCAKILRIEHEAIGYPSRFNILDTVDQKFILSPIYKKHEISSKTHSYSSLIDYISKNKVLGVSPDELLDKAKNDSEKYFARIYKDYQNEVQRIKAVDFDDLIILVNNLFKSNKAIAKKWSDKFDYVLVDEFQDTSWIQYEIMKSLSQHNNITIVGDPDQTIYTWRQADSTLILNFKKYYKKAKIVKLEQNYRSTENILDKANKLIRNNKKRIDKTLVSTKGPGDIIEFHNAFSDDAEARWVVEKINTLRKNRTQLKDITVLYRANYLSAPVEKALINQGINYVIYGGVKFYQRQEIKDALAFLKVINNGDEISLRRVINIPSRKIGKTALDKMIALSESKNKNLYNTIIKYFGEIKLSIAVKKDLAKFINLIRKYNKAIATNKISMVLSKFLIEIQYYSIWNPSTEMSRIENVKELIRTIENWEKQNPNGTIDDYINEISLYIDKNDNSFASDYVSLMTVHAAKGLEFENVFIVGFSDGVFPSKRAMDEQGESGLEEERRLAYVAATRAKDRLYISDSRGYSIDHRFQKKPSRFLSEMGINYREHTKEFLAPKNKSELYFEERNFVEGDQVSHTKFGNGVVVNVQGEIIEISFKKPHGVKTLMKNHKSLERLS